MMTNFFSTFSKQVLLFSATSILLVAMGCKENIILDPNLVPQDDIFNTKSTDTVTVITTTDYQDSLLTGGVYTNTSGVKTDRGASSTFYHAIGSITSDPVFGKSIGKSYFTLAPTKSNYTFAGKSQEIDSVVIAIPYVSAYADTFGTSVPQRFFLFRTDSLYVRDSAYFENKNVVYQTSNLLSTANFNFYKASIDSPIINGVKQVPQLRFKLPNWFGDSLLNDSSTIYQTQKTFIQWLKGFYVVPDSSKGNTMGYFNTYKAKMYIHYRDTSLTTNLPDTTTDIFTFDPSICNRFNSITRIYTNTISHPFINSGNARGDSLTFSQGIPGLSTIVKFPYITNFNNVAVNKAELVLTCPPSFTTQFDTTIYGLPFRLEMLKYEDGIDKLPTDYLLGVFYADGKKQIVNINGTNYVQYKFILTSTIQKAITIKNNQFSIKINASNTSLPIQSRSIFYGSQSSSLLKPKINIIFTNLH